MVTNWLKQGSAIQRLIAVNLIVFLAVVLVGIFNNFTNGGANSLVQILAANTELSVLITKPWSIISYMFVHQGLFHLFFNMLVLYFAGNLFTQFLGENRAVGTYFLGGIAGFLLFMLCYNIFPIFQQNSGAEIIGASAAVMAILVAIAVYTPNYRVVLMFIGPVKLKYIAIAYIALDILALQGNNNLGGHLAHLGGALFGYIMVKQLSRGNDWTQKLGAWIYGLGNLFKRRPTIRIVKKNTTSNRRPKTDAQYNAEKKAKQEEINRILDKISKSGYDSLSKREKEILFQASNNG